MRSRDRTVLPCLNAASAGVVRPLKTLNSGPAQTQDFELPKLQRRLVGYARRSAYYCADNITCVSCNILHMCTAEICCTNRCFHSTTTAYTQHRKLYVQREAKDLPGEAVCSPCDALSPGASACKCCCRICSHPPARGLAILAD